MYMVYIVLIELWTRSPKTEVENLKIRIVFFLNAYASICKFGKVQKTEETLANFSEKSKCLKKRKKRKKNLPLRFCIIF